MQLLYVENESDKKRRRVHVWESGSSGSENGQFLVKRFLDAKLNILETQLSFKL